MTYTLYQPDRRDINSIYIKENLGEAGQCPDLVQVGHADESSGHRGLCRYQEGCRGEGLSPMDKDTQQQEENYPGYLGRYIVQGSWHP